MIRLLILIFISLLIGYPYLIYPQNLEPKRGQATIVVGNQNSNDGRIVSPNVIKKRIIVENRYRPVIFGDLVRAGARIKTLNNGALEITLFNQRKFRIFNNTEIILEQIDDESITITLIQGKIFVYPATNSDFTFNINIPDSKVTSDQPSTNYTINHNNDTNESKITVINGSVFVESIEQSSDRITVTKGQSVTLVKDVTPKPSDIKPATPIELSVPENNLLSGQNSLSSYDPTYLVKSSDPFFETETTFEERRDAIRRYRSEDIFYWEFDTGVHYIVDDIYFHFSFKPRLKFDQLDIQLRIPVFIPFQNPIDPEQWYNYSEWDFQNTSDIFHDILLKFDHITFGERGKGFYFSMNDIPSVTLAHGLNVNRFNNIIFYPFSRKLGFLYDLDFETLSINGFVSDITEFKLFGIRIESKSSKSTEDNLYDYSRFGINYIMDTETRDKGGNPQVFIMSLDINFPLLNEKESNFNAVLFSEIAMQGYIFNDQTIADQYNTSANSFIVIDDSFGLLVGFKGAIYKSTFYKISYSYLSKGYVSEYFDPFYLLLRKKKFELLLTEDKPDFHGFLGGFGFDIHQLGNFYIEYYYETGSVSGLDKVNNRLFVELSSSEYLSPIFILSLKYYRYDIESFEDFIVNGLAEKAFLTIEFNYAMVKYLDLIFGYRAFFEENNGQFEDGDYFYINTKFTF